MRIILHTYLSVDMQLKPGHDQPRLAELLHTGGKVRNSPACITAPTGLECGTVAGQETTASFSSVSCFPSVLVLIQS